MTRRHRRGSARGLIITAVVLLLLAAGGWYLYSTYGRPASSMNFTEFKRALGVHGGNEAVSMSKAALLRNVGRPDDVRSTGFDETMLLLQYRLKTGTAYVKVPRGSWEREEPLTIDEITYYGPGLEPEGSARSGR